MSSEQGYNNLARSQLRALFMARGLSRSDAGMKIADELGVLARLSIAEISAHPSVRLTFREKLELGITAFYCAAGADEAAVKSLRAWARREYESARKRRDRADVRDKRQAISDLDDRDGQVWLLMPPRSAGDDDDESKWITVPETVHLVKGLRCWQGVDPESMPRVVRRSFDRLVKEGRAECEKRKRASGGEFSRFRRLFDGAGRGTQDSARPQTEQRSLNQAPVSLRT